MRRLVLVAALVLAASAFRPAPALAQGSGGTQWGVRGGVSFPNGDSSVVLDDGWHGGVTLNYEIPALPLAIRADGDYHHFSAKTGSGSTELYGGNVNLTLGLKIIAVKAYVLGGGDYYGARYSGSVAAASDSGFGWNAGAGVALVIGRVSLFVVGRYHEISLNSAGGGKFKFTPVSVGILF